MTTSPTIYDEVRNGMLPAHIYNDAEIFERERRNLFSRAWLFLGLVPFVGPLTLLVFALQPSAPRLGHPADASDPVPAGVTASATAARR